MSEFRKINRLLQTESSVSPGADDEDIAIFASYLSKVENLVVVVSDMARNTSRIYCGKFADSLGLKDYTTENSIWERLSSTLCLRKSATKNTVQNSGFSIICAIFPGRAGQITIWHPDCVSLPGKA